MTDLRVCIVGLGAMGADHLVRIQRRTKGARVVAAVARDGERAARILTGHPGVVVFPDLERAIAAQAADAYVVATPGHTHAALVETLLVAGLPVLCEKPLTTDVASAYRILEQDQRLGRPHVQLGFMRRFDPEYAALREMVATRTHGDLLMVHAQHRNATSPPGFTQSMLITDSLSHELDVLPWVAGSPISGIEVRFGRRNTNAASGLRDPLLVLVELANGTLLDVEMNVTAGFGYQVSTEAVFDRGVVQTGEFAGPRTSNAGGSGLAVPSGHATRFASAFDAQMQRWVDAVARGTLVDGPTAWDGLVGALACDAGVHALDGRVRTVDLPERPAFYR